MLPQIKKLTRTTLVLLVISLLISTNPHFNQTTPLQNFPTINIAQAQGETRAERLQQELNDMAASGVRGFLYWMYSGDRSQASAFGSDPFSFFRGDPICDVLRNNASSFNFIGVNIPSLGTANQRVPGAAEDALDYLSSQCGVNVIRIFGFPDRGGVATTNSIVSAAWQRGIKVIVALCDYPNTCSDLGITGTVRSNPTAWFESGWTQDNPGGNYDGSYRDYILDMAGALNDNPGLYGYELLNEPHCSGHVDCISPYISWAHNAAAAIRIFDNTHPIGIGQMASQPTTRGDSPGANQPGLQSDFIRSNSSGNINMASAHYYSNAEKQSALLANTQAASLGKFFYIGEYGFVGEDLPGVPGGGYVPCDQVSDIEPHPLRPYPGAPCGNLESPETPYCAMRPWAGTNITYLKNKNTCTSGGVCVEQQISGNYSIDPNSELPLVSVTRDGFDYLTFFNRSQEHHAAYLEGRAHYEIDGEPSITDGINDLVDRISIWNRLGIFRKLAPLSLQNNMKIENIGNVGNLIHNYIVSPDPYGVGGTPIRMTDFVGHYPPVYNCGSLTDPIENENCKLEFFIEMEEWRESIWGQLWPRVPMVTREDAYGYVSVIPEPGQIGPYGFTQQEATTGISIPHLPRLDAIADQLRKLLDPFLSEEQQTDPAVTDFGQPPEDGLANCNPNATATDTCIFDQPVIQDLANRWIGGPIANQVDRCYNDVIARAQSSGFNAALAMLIWNNESNASNYSRSAMDFGVNLESLYYNWEAQITRMIALARDIYPNQDPWQSCFGPTAPFNPATGQTMTATEAFLWIYLTGDCDTTDTEPGEPGYQNPGAEYSEGMKPKWAWISSCPFPDTPLTASIYPSPTTNQFAGLFPECEAIVPPTVDFNIFTPQTMIKNKAG